MLEVITKIVQHDEDGNVRELGTTGALLVSEDKLIHPSTQAKINRKTLDLLRSVAGNPILDNNILVDPLTVSVARHMLQLVDGDNATLDSARMVGHQLNISFTLSQELKNAATAEQGIQS